MKRTRLPRVSQKRKKDQATYKKLHGPFLEANPQCQCRPDDEKQCPKRSEQVHHRKGRHDMYLVVASWMACCRECHELIEQKRDWAKERGYLINRASSNPIEPLK